jgi:HK97 family phage portal protein
MRIAFEFERQRRAAGQSVAPREERAAQITQNADQEQLLAFFGLDTTKLPFVTTMSALKVPAVLAAVTFLSRTLATLTLNAFRDTGKGPEEVTGRLQTLVRDAPNPEWSSYDARVYFWQGVFLHGRGLFVILRQNGQPYEIWPMNPQATSVSMDGLGRKTYRMTTSSTLPIGKSYSAEDVIDVPFMLAPDMVNAWGPIRLGEKAIQLALAMNDYGSTFFAGGGVPPLALEGPLPQGNEGMKRAMGEIHRAIDAARESDKPVFPLPPGHKLSQVGYDPAKGQMTEARLLQIQEIARIYQIPPVFLQDLSHGTFSNTEQADLQLVKHLIGQWATAFEQQANLKLFGQMNGRRYVRHDLDSLMRGDFVSRMAGLASGVQNAIITPNGARKMNGDPPLDGGDQLFIQGATIPLLRQESQPAASPAPPTPDPAAEHLKKTGNKK